MLLFFAFAFGVYSVELGSVNGLDCQDILTYEEQPCTTMRTGMVRQTKEEDKLQVCTNKRWQPYHSNNRVSGLIGHWRMDEQTGNNVADDSGYENHGSASAAVPQLSKFSYGRYFDMDGSITIPDAPVLNFGISSFSVSGWQKIVWPLEYQRLSFGVIKGYGCYFEPGRTGWLPGWETSHGYTLNSLSVCIRDSNDVMSRKAIQLDYGYQPEQLIGQWAHYVVVFDREYEKKAFVYVNGKRQSDSLDISAVEGSVNNNRQLVFGTMYGWKTKGTLDEYRIYNKALDADEVAAIFQNHHA